MGVAFSKEEQPPDFLLNGFDVKKQLYNSVIDSNRARAQRAGVSLGVLCLDSTDSDDEEDGDNTKTTLTSKTKRKGDIHNPDSFEYPVFYKVVKGLTLDKITSRRTNISSILDENNEQLKSNLIEAVQYLIHTKNVTAITSDSSSCMMWFQDLIQQYTTSKPVILSPLVQLPTLMVTYSNSLSRRNLNTNSTKEIAILTSNTKRLEKLYTLIQDEFGINLFQDHHRFRVIDFSEEQQEILLYPGLELEDGDDSDEIDDDGDGASERTVIIPTNEILQTPGMVVTYVQRIQKAYPKVCALVLEWTDLLPFADDIRQTTQLPVYDIINCCDAVMGGSIPKPQFGKHDWQHEFDGLREVYKFNKLNLNQQEWELLAQTLPSATWVHKPKSLVEKEQYVASLPVATWVPPPTSTAQQQQGNNNGEPSSSSSSSSNQKKLQPPLDEKEVVDDAHGIIRSSTASSSAAVATSPQNQNENQQTTLQQQKQQQQASSSTSDDVVVVESESSNSGQQQQQQPLNNDSDHLTLPLTAALLAIDETE